MIPGKPTSSKPQDFTTSDGLRVKFKVPGLTPPIKPEQTEERGAAEPPRVDPRPPINPNHVGL